MQTPYLCGIGGTHPNDQDIYLQPVSFFFITMHTESFMIAYSFYSQLVRRSYVDICIW